MLDPRAHHRQGPMNSLHLYDVPKTHNYNHRTWEDTTNSDFGPSSKLPTSSEFRTESKDVDVDAIDDDDSGICSPPLWRTSPPHYGSLSPSSRTQAIVRGQRELMEMVRDMPETTYELSLKDLVEHHHRVKQDQNTVEDARELRNVYNKSGGGSGRKVGANLNKSGSNIHRGGFYLKMGFPFSLGSKNKKQNKKNNKKKKKDESAMANSRSKVSPRPSAASDGTVKNGGVDKEWWKKVHSKSKESDSGVSSSINSGSQKSSGSSSSNSSTASNKRPEKNVSRCWPFIRRPKSITLK